MRVEVKIRVMIKVRIRVMIKVRVRVKLKLNAMLSKEQFTFKVNSIDSLQGIEIEIHG